ncbi:formate dehydrogenase-N subunit alpha [Nonomuraea sp. SYSU D8015]|uniref:formate dehydrogenase-N subunit alpha n=1 Tax=Nonomuraea sp. SYSU D8015 TaxID=2593644 RepID=UPI001CB73B41|nr:formate dehydrogenase-N subunit alpha [Nonomuraea sp. SYSU D8015]
MVSLAATFGRGAMTNHWRDIRHADLILVNGANPAEAHPVGFRWLMRAKLDRGAKIIHADPRFTRTSAVADTYVRIRTGTDVAYFGGLINYILQNRLYHDEYVRWATNAGFVVKEGYAFKDGMFNGYDQEQGVYNTKLWAYETDDEGHARIDLDHPRSVINLLRAHYQRYDPDTVARITGIPREQFLQVARQVGEMGRPDKVMTIVYAVGLTHHTTGVQLIRSGALLQLLLGNMGRPGGGMNAERGHANIQGNTDHAISWDILPGYLRIPAPGQKDIKAYLDESASVKQHPRAVNFFGENYRRYLVSLLKAWYGEAATKDNEFAFDYLPKPAANASWISIFDQALRGKMQGILLSGMTATSIGPDSNQVLQALSNLKWLCVMDPFATTSSEFWRAPGMDPAKIQTEVFMLPATHWIEKDGSFTNSGRWAQWKDQVLPPEGEARHDHWILAELFLRVRDLYETQGGKFPDPVLKMALPYRNPRKPELDEIAQEINGRDLRTGKRLSTFVDLKDDGTTSAGDWIYTGHYPEEGNLTKRRDGVQDPGRNDPTGMGFYPNWAWSWPANRRILYNRASADENGRPWDPERPGIAWENGQWAGDVPDYPPTTGPGPDAPLPFIMTGEGVGRLFSNAVADGPFPEHYEPIESPIANPLHPQVSATPVAFRYDERAGRPNRFGTPADYPYVATSYRLTEHEHYVTQNVEHLVQLQPEAFVEVPAGLAREKGIATGDRVRVSSRRGKLEVRAVVTNRLGPLNVDGRTVYQIGIPIHWGFVGINTGQHWLANALTPFVGDASARTPEYKAFLVDIEKI